eukprot:5450083-Prymnesium_polylepis.1
MCAASPSRSPSSPPDTRSASPRRSCRTPAARRVKRAHATRPCAAGGRAARAAAWAPSRCRWPCTCTRRARTAEATQPGRWPREPLCTRDRSVGDARWAAGARRTRDGNRSRALAVCGGRACGGGRAHHDAPETARACGGRTRSARRKSRAAFTVGIRPTCAHAAEVRGRLHVR